MEEDGLRQTTARQGKGRRDEGQTCHSSRGTSHLKLRGAYGPATFVSLWDGAEEDTEEETEEKEEEQTEKRRRRKGRIPRRTGGHYYLWQAETTTPTTMSSRGNEADVWAATSEERSRTVAAA